MNQEEFSFIANTLRHKLELDGEDKFSVRVFMENSDVLITGTIARVEDRMGLFIRADGGSDIFCPASHIVAIRIFSR